MNYKLSLINFMKKHYNFLQQFLSYLSIMLSATIKWTIKKIYKIEMDTKIGYNNLDNFYISTRLFPNSNSLWINHTRSDLASTHSLNYNFILIHKLDHSFDKNSP